MIDSLLDKKRLLEACIAPVRSRIEQINGSLEQAREASQQETKSSAGDKYETGREMMRIQSDMQALHLYEAQDLLHRLDRIDASQIHTTVRPGAVVRTDAGLYFICQSLGPVILDGVEYQTMSLASPLGKVLKGLSAGDTAPFRDGIVSLLAVF